MRMKQASGQLANTKTMHRTRGDEHRCGEMGPMRAICKTLSCLQDINIRILLLASLTNAFQNQQAMLVLTKDNYSLETISSVVIG